jgi:hypothetical protein
MMLLAAWSKKEAEVKWLKSIKKAWREIPDKSDMTLTIFKWVMMMMICWYGGESDDDDEGFLMFHPT